MLEKEKAIDAVLIATPDHLHAYISILAMKAGKHVYCEKPLTLRRLGRPASWPRSPRRPASPPSSATTDARARGIARPPSGSGTAPSAQVREVHAWASAGWFATGRGRPEGTPDVPPGLNWDLWLGPAEARPYHPAYAPFNWRGWWAFGGGGLPDVAVHHLDPAFYALELDAPETVEATAPVRGRRGRLDRRAGHLAIRAAPEHGAGERLLVRRRPPPADAPWHRSRRSPPAHGRRRRGDHLHRGEGDHHLRRVVRHAPPAAA